MTRGGRQRGRRQQQRERRAAAHLLLQLHAAAWRRGSEQGAQRELKVRWLFFGRGRKKTTAFRGEK